MKYFLFKVDLNRTFKFINSNADYEGIPIMASNMDTVGTFEMAIALNKVSYVEIELNFPFEFKCHNNEKTQQMYVIIIRLMFFEVIYTNVLYEFS